MAVAMKQDVAFNPIEIGLFGADAIMLEPQPLTRYALCRKGGFYVQC